MGGELGESPQRAPKEMIGWDRYLESNMRPMEPWIWYFGPGRFSSLLPPSPAYGRCAAVPKVADG